MNYMYTLKASLVSILRKAIVTRERTRSGEDRDVVTLIKGVVAAMDVLGVKGDKSVTND